MAGQAPKAGLDLKAIADEIDTIAGSVPNPRGRQLGRIAAELRGEEVEPTPNELREAERAAAAQAEAEAQQAAAAQAAAAEPGNAQ